MFMHGVLHLQISLSLPLQGKNKDLLRENNPHVNFIHICKFKIPTMAFCFFFFDSILALAAILMPVHTSFGDGLAYVKH